MPRVTAKQYEQQRFAEALQAYAVMSDERRQRLDKWLGEHIIGARRWNALLSDEVKEYSGMNVDRTEVDGALMAAGYTPRMWLSIEFKIQTVTNPVTLQHSTL